MDESIVKPDYAQTGRPSAPKPMLPWVIEVKTSSEIEKMRKAGRLAREILDMAGRAVLTGVTTDEIDTMVHNTIVEVRTVGRER
jgi:methionyl aminopeptidase